jgi:nucleosome binding factor SPN SPT16 subunit
LAKKSSKTTKGSAKGGVTVNFKGVSGRDGGARSAKVPEDDYLVKVIKAESGKSAQKQTPQAVVTLQIIEGKYKNKKLIHRMNLGAKSLWVLRNFVEAIGVKVKEGKMQLKYKEWLGKKLGVTVEHDEYEADDGKTKTSIKISDTFPASEMEGRSIKKKGVALDDDEDDEDEEDDEEEDDEEDDDEDEDEDEEDSEDLDDLDLDDV